jgi:hypothetical protein
MCNKANSKQRGGQACNVGSWRSDKAARHAMWGVGGATRDADNTWRWGAMSERRSDREEHCSLAEGHCGEKYLKLSY